MKAAQKTRRTLGLAMIMKDEIQDLDRIINDYGKYFDKIYVTVTNKKTHAALLKKYTNNSPTADLLELSYFKWIDHFGKARIYNQRQVKTDYWMWIDTDDEIEGAENIPAMVEYMDANNLDDVWFQYDYIRRVNATDHELMTWRERIVRTTSKLKWSDDPVHENINAEGDKTENFLSNVIIRHRRTAEQQITSLERNRLILEKDWQRIQRAPTAWYLGASLKDAGDYNGAIEKLLFVAKHGEGWALRFFAWRSLFECYLKTGQYDAALAATDECVVLDPSHPEPWYQKFEVYKAMDDYAPAMQSAEIAMSKQVGEEQAIVLGHDMSLHQYRGPFAVAQAYLSIGNVERAYELYCQVKKIAPQYIEALSAADGMQWSDKFEQARNGTT